jgi:hypothetical protein
VTDAGDGDDPAPDPDLNGSGAGPALGQPVGGPRPSAALAANWKTVLGIDAAMGGVVMLGGLVCMIVWSFALGVFLAGLGLFYVAMVARRARLWSSVRRHEGL